MPVINGWIPGPARKGTLIERPFSPLGIASATGMAGLINLHNSVNHSRRRVLGSFMFPQSFSALRTEYWFQIASGPAAGGVRVAFLMAPGKATANNDYGFTVDGYFNGYRNQANNSYSSYGFANFDDLSIDDFELYTDADKTPLTNGTYEVYIELVNNTFNPIGLVFYESSTSSFTDTYNFIDASKYLVGSPVTGGQINELVGTVAGLWENGTVHFSHAFTQAASVTNNSTTFKNVLDGGTGGWSSTVLGHPYWPHYRGKLVTELSNATFWCYVTGSGTYTGEVRLVDDNGTMTSITGINSDGYWSSEFSYDASTTARRIAIVESARSTGTGNFVVQSYGFYDSP